MKARILTGALLAALIVPSLAFAAENGGEGGAGSWLKLIFYVINFAAFLIVIFYYAGPSTSEYFKERSRLIRSDLERLEAGQRDALELAKRARARIAGLEEELKRLVEEVEGETAFLVQKIREAGGRAAARTRRDAELTAQALAGEGQRRVRERLAKTASKLARELIGRSFESSDQQRLVDGFVERLRSEAPR